MVYSILAAVVALVHGAFIAFVVAGGLLLLRWPGLVRLHVPVALYGMAIMVFGWRCPLSGVEIELRRRAGESVEWTAFINHYILAPLGLSGGEWFIMPGAIALILLGNGWPYWRLLRERLKRSGQ